MKYRNLKTPVTRIIAIVILILSQICAHGQDSRDPSWSPDGSHIVYVSAVDGKMQLHVMDKNGENKRTLANLNFNCYYPFFSPSGSKITFISYPKGNAVVCTIDSDGKNYRALTDATVENADPHWSPDGTQITFYSNRDGNNEIYIMSADGKELRRITNNTWSDQTPSISPDGKQIVFVSDRDGDTEIYVMDIDGKNPRRITTDPRIDRVPSWSPDGKKVVWYSRESPDVARSAENSWEGSEIYEIGIDGKNRRQLTHNCVRDQGPVYSPDGTKILFVSMQNGTMEIYSMNADGQDVIRLTGEE